MNDSPARDCIFKKFVVMLVYVNETEIAKRGGGGLQRNVK